MLNFISYNFFKKLKYLNFSRKKIFIKKTKLQTMENLLFLNFTVIYVNYLKFCEITEKLKLGTIL